MEPLLVLIYNLDYPLHGYCHTLLIGGLVGLLFATAAYPLRNLIGKSMKFLRLPYSPTYLKMAFSGVAGACLHILFDAILYLDIRPFYPFEASVIWYLVPWHCIRYMFRQFCASLADVFLYCFYSKKDKG
ncbi:MAG: hypothetical protein HC898_09855 [Phycisphaerales bacterium]|nr:hypothetical protein [Phycisphaerales bacterium]